MGIAGLAVAAVVVTAAVGPGKVVGVAGAGLTLLSAAVAARVASVETAMAMREVASVGAGPVGSGGLLVVHSALCGTDAGSDWGC